MVCLWIEGRDRSDLLLGARLPGSSFLFDYSYHLISISVVKSMWFSCSDLVVFVIVSMAKVLPISSISGVLLRTYVD